ncbi:calretinin isoform X4 [Rhineura floridana]|uniref:calretinin isoform X4 n=1 Tax=Rhineura floridana TaxID=261503 RepID=UPI002AC8709D|nr:calretinin isoform X4 [Rhineura floridana]
MLMETATLKARNWTASFKSWRVPGREQEWNQKMPTLQRRCRSSCGNMTRMPMEKLNCLSWHRFCPQRRTSCCVSDSMLAPVLNSWRLGGNTIQTAVATLKPMSSRWVELGSVCLWDHELNGFLSDLLEKANRPYDEPKLQEYTQTILRMFDLNGDGKLCLSEMSRLLPVQENFLLKFQEVKLNSEEFNAIFAFYDKDGSGFIDENELDGLLKDLYEKHKKEMSIHQLTSYRKSIMNLSDGGKLYCKELEIVLCSEPLL